MLLCPNCKQILIKNNNTYSCINKHSFDISKYGYVNLLLANMTNSNFSGDSKEMVIARNNFLDKGFYENLTRHLQNTLEDYIILDNTFILDAGCGQGYFTDKIQTHFPNSVVFGIDVSKQAIIQASKQNKNITFLVASIANIPIKDRSVDIILNIFAPHFNDEFSRVLKDDGILIKVIPDTDHLWELKDALYSTPYLNDNKSIILDSFDLVTENSLNYKIKVDNFDLINLFKMTPYYHKTSNDDKSKLNDIQHLEITISFKILLYKKIKPIH